MKLWACAWLALVHSALATYVSLPFANCSTTTPASAENIIAVSEILGQYDTGQSSAGHWGNGAASLAAVNGSGNVLRLVAIGTVGAQSAGFSSVTNYLATVVTDSQVLTFDVFSNQSALCSSIRNTTGAVDPTGSGCPYGPGDVAFGIDVQTQHAFPLTTLVTRIRILDTSVPPLQLGCYDISATPFYPSAWPYELFLWLPVGIAIAFAALSVIGRIWAAHISALLDREAMLASSLTAKLSPQRWRQRVAPVLWSAASGIGLQASAPLRRFATPGARDVVWLVQWVCLHGMVAVNWPRFVYPIYAKTAWSMLAFNITLTQDSHQHVDPLLPSQLSTPFDQQLANVNSPLYLDAALPNVLLNLNGTRDGLDSLASAIGLRRQDLFGISVATFLVICAGFVGLSTVFFLIDTLLAKIAGSGSAGAPGARFTTGDGIMYAQKTSSERSADDEDFDGKQPPAHLPPQPPARHPWYKTLSGVSVKAHLRLLQGNLTRMLLLWHLPIVIFSTYQLELAMSVASTGSVVLAALSLVFFGVAVPALLTFKVHRTSTVALQTDMATGLGYGPFYSVYSERSYTFMGLRLLLNLSLGVVVGAAQRSGTAQAIVILVCELVETLITTLWLPWGDGAEMGPLSFVLSVARIVTAVLLIVLSPAVGISLGARAWIAYVILVVQAAVGLLFLLLLVTKALELCVRIFGGVPFDESASRNRAGGLSGALRRWDREGKKGLRQSRPPLGRHPSGAAMENGSEQHLHSRPTSMATSGYHDPFSVHSPQSLMSPSEDMDGYAMSPVNGHWGAGEYMPTQAWSSDSAPATGFTVVRGGRATDASPYAARDQYYTRQRARSFSAEIDYASDPQRSRPRSSIDLLSNANNVPDSALSAEMATASSSTKASKRQSASSGSGLFGFFKRTPSHEAPSGEDISSDEEEEEGERAQPSTTRWPFGIRTRRQRTPDVDNAAIEPETGPEEEEQPPPKSFVVVRAPRPPVRD